MHREVQQWVDARNCAASEPASIGITWSDSYITEAENWIYDACVAVQSENKGVGEISIQSLQSGLVAEIEVVLAEGDSHDLSPYWDWFVRDWFLSSKYVLRSSPSYELYIETTRGLKVRLCLPLEPNAWRNEHAR